MIIQIILSWSRDYGWFIFYCWLSNFYSNLILVNFLIVILSWTNIYLVLNFSIFRTFLYTTSLTLVNSSKLFLLIKIYSWSRNIWILIFDITFSNISSFIIVTSNSILILSRSRYQSSLFVFIFSSLFTKTICTYSLKKVFIIWIKTWSKIICWFRILNIRFANYSSLMIISFLNRLILSWS